MGTRGAIETEAPVGTGMLGEIGTPLEMEVSVGTGVTEPGRQLRANVGCRGGGSLTSGTQYGYNAAAQSAGRL